METLTKENYWNKMHTKYPFAMERFCSWIDKYKFDHDWEELWNSGLERFNAPLSNDVSRSPKYHELPIAMQFGIFIQFLKENARPFTLAFRSDIAFSDNIEMCLANLQLQIQK